MRKTLQVILCMLLCITMLPTNVYAKISTGDSLGYNKVVSTKNYNIAPGIKETDITLNNSDGTNQSKGYVIEVDLNNPTTQIIAGYKDYNSDKKWGLQPLVQQAQVAEKELKKTDPNVKVVGGINASFFNMATGEPFGALVMNGKVVHEAAPGSAYIAVMQDGEIQFREGTEPIGSGVKEAISGSNISVKDGVIRIPEDAGAHDPSQRLPRTSIGMKADGTFVLFSLDGRQVPTSHGATLYEMAEIMLSMGCVNVLDLDGGGSVTFASRKEGQDKISVVNSPSDGSARAISTSILVVSTAKPSGEFDHAILSPNSELYTPESEVQFSALAADSSGSSVAMPEGVKWQLNAESQHLGTIDANTGLFKANENTGVATIELVLNNKVVGTTNIEICQPDQLSFSTDEISLGFEASTDFGLIVRNQGRDINYKDGDFIWEMSNPQLGTFDGNIFTSSDGESLNGDITISSKYDSTVTGTIHVIVGMLPTIVMDFEDYIDPVTGEVIPAKDYYTIGKGAGTGTKYYTSNYGKGGNESAEIVSIDDEEPVRFGSHSLKLNYDFTKTIEATEGACFGTSESMVVPGTPTGIGVWVYAPEGTGVVWEGDGTQAGFWLRGYVSDGNGVNMPYDFTLEPKNVTGDQQPGIYWEGWKYLEADLTKLSGPFSIQPGMTFRLMYVPSTKMGTKTAGSIYFDNLQFVYGANVDDVDNPVIDSITANGEKLENNMVITTNKVSFESTFHDFMNKYTSGIDKSTIRMYLDGVNVVDNDSFTYVADPDGTKNNLYDVNLLNGIHSLTVSVRDNFGNETSETRYFLVEGNTQDIPTVFVETQEKEAILGDTVSIQIKSSNVSKISEFTTNIKVGDDYKNYEVKFSDAFDGETHYNKLTKNLMLSAKANGQGGNEDNVLATITYTIPTNLTKNSVFNYSIKAGSYLTDQGLFTYSVPEKNLKVSAPYVISYDPIVVGQPGKITVTDNLGNLASKVTLYLEDGTELGVTDANGVLTTDYFSQEASSYTVYVKDEVGKISFQTTIYSFDAEGEASGKPFNVLNNATKNPTTEKNISWMTNTTVVGQQKIQVRLKGSKDWRTENALTTTQTFNQDANKIVNVNNATLYALKPGSVYEYRVGNDDNWSEIYEFTTQKVSNKTNFFVLGDIQSEDLTNINAILDDIKAKDYSFGIQTGDAVENANEYSYWTGVTSLLDVNRLNDTDMVHVLGNHEYTGDADGSVSDAIYNLPSGEAGSCYSVIYGNVYVGVINYTNTKTQLQNALNWIKEDALNSSAKWKILTMHQPPYYTNVAGGNSEINSLVPPIVDEVGFDAVFSGHDHTYARTAPLKDRKVDPNGTVYFISGSSGEKSYSVSDNPDFHFEMATQDYNGIYISVDADYNELRFTTYDVASDGSMEVFDTYVIESETCQNDEHSLLYDFDTQLLTCEKCGYIQHASESLYAGEARDKETKRYMIFVSGKPMTGHQYVDSKHYYFDEKGLGLEGTQTIVGEECIFKDGQFVKSTNADVVTAGMCGKNVGFVLYANQTLKIDGSGSMESHSTAGTVPWYEFNSRIRRIEIGKDITDIGSYSFAFAQSVREVIFEEGSKLNSVQDLGFYYMSNLKEIKIPEGVKTIGHNVFSYGNGLIRVSIPSSVNYISNSAFKNCDLEKLTLVVNKGSYSETYAKAQGFNYVYSDDIVEDGLCDRSIYWEITKDGTLKLHGKGDIASFYESGIESVPWYSRRHDIKKVEIGKYITSVGTYSFREFDNCTSVVFEEGSKVEKLGAESFKYMSNLKEIKLPNGLKTIGNYTFADTGLEKVTIPSSVTDINPTSFRNSSSELTLVVDKGSYAESYAKGQKIKYIYSDGTKPSEDKNLCGIDARWEITKDGILKITGKGELTAFYAGGIESVPWYSNRHDIKKVEIGKDITVISTYSFRELDNCTSVVFEEGSKVVKLGAESFKYMKNLKEIELPNGLKTIGNYTFADTGLEKVTIPSSVVEINPTAFSNSSDKLTLVVDKESYAETYAKAQGIKYIYSDGSKPSVDTETCGKDARWQITKDGVLKITGKGELTAFYDGGVASVPWYSNRHDIKKVEIGKDITVLSTYSFRELDNCTSVVFEEGSKVVKLGAESFRYMKNLKEIVLPDGLKTIGNYTFADTGLEKVTIPSSVEAINESAFKHSSDKLTLVVDKGSFAEAYAKSEGIKYIYNDGSKPSENTETCGKTARWEITKDGVLKITGKGELTAFYDGGFTSVPWYSRRHDIKKVEIGKDITVLSTYSFRELDNCTSVVFEEGSKTVKLGAESFRYMKNLKEIVLPDGLKTIGNYTFANTGLEKVIIPSSVADINQTAFKHSSNKLTLVVEKGSYAEAYAKGQGIKYIYSDGSKPSEDNSSCGTNVNWEITKDGVLKLTGKGELTAFYDGGVASVPWYSNRHDIKKVEIGKDITVLSTYSFRELDNCTSVVFEEGSKVVKLGAESFRYMKNLKEIVLPDGLKTIGNYTFANTGLEKVTIPSSVEAINDSAFKHSSSKLTLVVEEGSYAETYANAQGIQYIYSDASSDDETQPSVDSGTCGANVNWETTEDGILKLTGEGELTAFYEDGIKSVPWYSKRHSIKAVEIGKDITVISTYSFRELDNCTSVVFEEGSKVVKLGAESFRYMKNLKEIVLPDGLKTIGNYTFAYTGLERVVIPSSVDAINETAFRHASENLVLVVEEGSYAESFANSLDIEVSYE